MTLFLRFIGMMLAFQLAGLLADATPAAALAPTDSASVEALCALPADDDSSFSMLQWTLPDEAEPTVVHGITLFRSMSRLLRLSTEEHNLALKERILSLQERSDSLMQQRAHLYGSVPFLPCYPPCAYYIFTLRRILI